MIFEKRLEKFLDFFLFLFEHENLYLNYVLEKLTKNVSDFCLFCFLNAASCTQSLFYFKDIQNELNKQK